MKKITDRVFISEAEPETDRPCLGYIRGDHASLLVDAGNSPAHAKKLQSQLKDLGLGLPDYVVLTHSHWDHSFGLCAWEAISYAGKRTNEYLEKMARWSWDGESFEQHVKTNEIPLFCKPHMLLEYPDLRQIRVEMAAKSVEKETEIGLGGLTCRILPTVSPHTDDGILVYVPEEKLLFSGDAHCEEVIGTDWIDREEPLTQFLWMLEGLDFTLCVTGHSGVVEKEELLKDLRERKRKFL